MNTTNRYNYWVSLFFLILGVWVFLPAGCGKRSGEEQKIKIGFLVNYPEEAWFQNEWKAAEKCGEDYGLEVIKIGVRDTGIVLSVIDNLAAVGAQGFVICAPDVRMGPAILAKADSCGLKVVTVDDELIDADENFMDVPYIGVSAFEAGQLVGRALYEEFKRREWDVEDTAACAITFDELNTVKQRTDGATAALIECGFPAEKIYRMPEKMQDVPHAFDAASVLITQHPEVKRWLVFSVNDEGVLGAVRALEGRGFDADSIVGIGLGGISAVPELEKTEPTGFFATCLMDSWRHGYESAENLYKWIKYGIKPPRDTRTDGTIITRENFRQVMKKRHILD